MADKYKGSPKRVEIAERRKIVMALRAEGMRLNAIAEALSQKGITGPKGAPVTEGTISKDIKACLKALAEDTDASAEEFRGMEMQRLDMVLSALAKKVRLGDVAAIAQWHKNIEVRAKLLGLNAPVQIQVQETVRHEIEIFVQFLQGRLSDGAFGEVMQAIAELSEDRGLEMSKRELPKLPVGLDDI